MFLRESDASLLFADYLQQVHSGRNYFHGTISLMIDAFEVLVSYQIFTESELYYELEYVITSYGIELAKKEVILNKTSFENRFRVLISSFLYNLKMIDLEQDLVEAELIEIE